MKSIEEQTREAALEHQAFMGEEHPTAGTDFMYGVEWELNRDKWISVKDRPLFTTDKNGDWICTEDGEKEFIAAVPYISKILPGQELWWIRHCVVEDGIGLCVVCDDYNEPAGWTLKHVTHYIPLPEPPKQKED